MAFDHNAPNDDADEAAPLADINVTPFIDVMLVLLVIFMVTAPMLATGMKVELPKASAAKTIDEPKPLIVSVDAEGKIQVGDRVVTKEELVPTVKAALGSEKRIIQLRGDNRTSYGNVVTVMDQLSGDGLPKFVLAFDRPRREP
jgi:biopolymer transport protein TolR